MAAAEDISGLTAETADPSARRTRRRPQPIKLDDSQRIEIANRVIRFRDDDDEARSIEKALRKQRYAKLMQFSSEVTEPYPGASNVQLPDMMSACLRTEDTLVNSAMSTRPMVNAKAVSEADRQRERKTDLLLDYQFFVEQDGEALIEQAAMNFTRDGHFTALTRWIKDHDKIHYPREWAPIPFGNEPREYFSGIIAKAFSPGSWVPQDEDGWDWIVRQQRQEFLVRFYTEDDGSVIMQVEGEVETYCGPRPLIYDYEDVLAPSWALNLQPPGPSNPHGAPHVIFRDYPTKEEILRLVESRFYDLIDVDDLDGIEHSGDWTDSDRELSRQRQTIRGQDPDGHGYDQPDNHVQIQRLLCFDVWEGLNVVWWVLDTGAGVYKLLRARPLTEHSPGIPPMRPIAHTTMIPVQGTWVGMGLPELMESMHDFKTTNFNIMVDASNFEVYPIIKYRQSSNLKPESFQGLAPGDGIPMQDPQRDLMYERLNAQATQIGTNMIALAEDMTEKLTSIGDIQLGRIPTGKSAALRTASGVQQVLAQGEARPERILRRFFKGITGIFRHMYRQDQHFLSEEKKFRVIDVSQPDEDPFISISRHEDLKDFLFDFHANVLNSSKVALQQSLNEIMTLSGNPLFLQTGISTPDTLYRATADYFSALGQRPEKYLNKPSPTADNPPIYAEEALGLILKSQMPKGPPAEGDFDQHMQKLQALLGQSDESGIRSVDLLSDPEKQMLGLYIQQLQQLKLQAQQQTELMASAQQFQAQQQQKSGAPGGGEPKKEKGPVMTEKNDVRNEALPSSGTPQ